MQVRLHSNRLGRNAPDVISNGYGYARKYNPLSVTSWVVVFIMLLFYLHKHVFGISDQSTVFGDYYLYLFIK